MLLLLPCFPPTPPPPPSTHICPVDYVFKGHALLVKLLYLSIQPPHQLLNVITELKAISSCSKIFS